MEQRRLAILTRCQRDVWELYDQGLTRKKIAEKLGITYGAVRQHLRLAERRFDEYDRLCALEEKNQQPVSFPLTRGEVKLIIDALWAYEQQFEKGVHKPVNVDWAGRLPVETKLIADLYERAQVAIYGRPFRRIFFDDF